jgi:hypothetical protein
MCEVPPPVREKRKENPKQPRIQQRKKLKVLNKVVIQELMED